MADVGNRKEGVDVLGVTFGTFRDSSLGSLDSLGRGVELLELATAAGEEDEASLVGL